MHDLAEEHGFTPHIRSRGEELAERVRQPGWRGQALGRRGRPFLAQPQPRHPHPLVQERREPPRPAPTRQRPDRVQESPHRRPTGIGPKPLADFAWRRKPGQHDSLCRSCRSLSGKEHYAANRQSYIDRARARKTRVRLERTAYLIEYFKSHPCRLWTRGPGGPRVDHLRDKSFTIGNGVVGSGWERLLDEVKKCEVVYANCHRRRTARRRGSVRVMLMEGGSAGS